MSSNSSTGSATPSSLYKLYKNCGAVAANPCTLRRQFADAASFGGGQNFNLLGLKGAASVMSASRSGYTTVPQSVSTPFPNSNAYPAPQPQRSSSPPRMAFRQLASRPASTPLAGTDVRMVSLTLASLDMTRR